MNEGETSFAFIIHPGMTSEEAFLSEKKNEKEVRSCSWSLARTPAIDRHRIDRCFPQVEQLVRGRRGIGLIVRLQ